MIICTLCKAASHPGCLITQPKVDSGWLCSECEPSDSKYKLSDSLIWIGEPALVRGRKNADEIEYVQEEDRKDRRVLGKTRHNQASYVDAIDDDAEKETISFHRDTALLDTEQSAKSNLDPAVLKAQGPDITRDVTESESKDQGIPNTSQSSRVSKKHASTSRKSKAGSNTLSSKQSLNIYSAGVAHPPGRVTKKESRSKGSLPTANVGSLATTLSRTIDRINEFRRQQEGVPPTTIPFSRDDPGCRWLKGYDNPVNGHQMAAKKIYDAGFVSRWPCGVCEGQGETCIVSKSASRCGKCAQLQGYCGAGDAQ